MNEEFLVKIWVLVEANRALRNVMSDPNSYYAKVFPDDAANIREAANEIDNLIRISKQP